MQNDIWVLESQEEMVACDWINQLYDWAKEGDEKAKEALLMLYDGSDWEDIQEKMETEGSVWYVWYLNGVRKLISIINNKEKNVKNQTEG